MQIVTTDDMVNYCLHKLGYPCTEIEMVVEEQNGLGHIHMAINDTLDWFYKINQDEASYMDGMVLRLKAGVIQYRVPDEVMEVVDVSPSYGNTFSPMMAWDVGPGESLMGVGGAGLGGLGQFDLITYSGAMRYLQDVKKLVCTQYNIKLHPVEHILRVYPTPKSDRIAMATVYVKSKKYEVFANPLFRDMAVARCQIQLGEILSKDDITLPGGSKVNGDRILQRGQEQWDKLFKLLQDMSAQPLMFPELS